MSKATASRRNKTPTLYKLASATLVTKAGGDGVFTAVISTDSVDEVGDVLLPSGADVSGFDKRQTVFWNHDYDEPIGKAIGPTRITDHTIESDFVFAERPATHEGEWFPDTVKALVQQEIVRGVSVGFNSAAGPRKLTADERMLYPKAAQIFPQWSLTEWSIAPAQCNPDAVIVAIGKGLITPEFAKSRLGIDPSVTPEKPPVEPPKRKKIVILIPSFPPPPAPDHKKSAERAVARRLGLLYLDAQ